MGSAHESADTTNGQSRPHPADAAGLKTSRHSTDELSAHLLCASEQPVYPEKHAFALDRYLGEPQAVVDGHVRPTETPGTGLRFSAQALEPHRVA